MISTQAVVREIRIPSFFSPEYITDEQCMVQVIWLSWSHDTTVETLGRYRGLYRVFWDTGYQPISILRDTGIFVFCFLFYFGIWDIKEFWDMGYWNLFWDTLRNSIYFGIP